MAIAYPGGNNTFVKDLDASGRLITEYSRNPDEFALNSYIQLSNVEKSAGYYLKITPEEAQLKFGFLLDALQYGAPPHGGMAAGVDRMVMLLCGVQNLREITLFPMNQRAEDLLMGAPSLAMAKQLRELNIRVVEQPPKA